MLRKLFALSIVAAMTSSAAAATITGTPADGKPTISFSSDGHVIVVSDGVPVGLFDVLSDVPIFNSTVANLPAGGLFTTDSPLEKAWASLGGASAFTNNLDLGAVANLASIGNGAAGQAFLNQHLTITYSGGFGTANVNGDVIGPPNVPEPMTLSMLGLAMVGGLGFFRRHR